VVTRLDPEFAGSDLVLEVLALVVVLLHIDDKSSAGLQRDECHQLQSAHRSTTMHSLSLS
jgi:hypothetical protein